MDIDEKLISAFFSTGKILKEKMFFSSDNAIPFSFTQFETLKFIKNRKETTMKELSGFLQVKPPSATTLTDSLVKNGYICRNVSTKDRRSVELSLTKKGHSTLDDCYAKAKIELKKIFSSLNNTDKKEMATILQKILKKSNEK